MLFMSTIHTRTSMQLVHSLFRLLISLSVIFVAISCSTPTLITDIEPEENEIEVAEVVRGLLEQANNSDSPERDVFYLRAANQLITIEEYDWARNLLASIDPDLLFVEDFVNYTLTYSEIAIETDAYFLAQRILTNPRVEQQWASYSPEEAQLLRVRRAELFALLGDANKSVYERVRLSEFGLEQDLLDNNQDAIWESLMAVSDGELELLRDSANDPILKGWYTLASISKNDNSDLDRQLANIEQWMLQWPNHPASLHLPSDLQLLKQLVEQQPQSVALLLPLNDDNATYRQAARDIRDGFMAAYFQSQRQGSKVPQIRIFDTSQSDIHTVYDLAVSDGAEFIVGPLIKSNVEELSLRLDLDIPTLALNFADSDYGFPANLYQFSLDPEGEAKQVANRAWLEGHRRAMILVPQNDLGTRSANAFTYAWESLGGVVVQRSYFDKPLQYSTVIQEGLLVTESEARRRDIRRVVGSSIEFEARRRQDIDFVFMVARSEEAQGLKPTLKLHRAANVPVYATSRVYQGIGDKKNRDLNSIRFNTLPWLFADNDEKQSISENTRNPNNHFYAMGIDSYRLYPRLPQLQQRPGAKYYGQTGALHLANNQKVERDQIWAHIVNGEATELPAIVSEVVNEEFN